MPKRDDRDESKFERAAVTMEEGSPGSEARTKENPLQKKQEKLSERDWKEIMGMGRTRLSSVWWILR
ncbi:hypothetical protein [Domibacillus aminovorans]|uniref:hypothetical protein n=1 Tax=Domibacillus aminovorans TaxID=29332 RepID=UPI0014710FCC|nr:hypothetical protein [Domibacillus aminovorans]